MQVLTPNADTRPSQPIYGSNASLNASRDKTSCWYCNQLLSTRRSFCSTECREALYEDNEYAKGRRRILGCQC